VLKIGIIGLGDIAQKAYLPIIGQTKGIDVHLFTRNKSVLHKIGEQYRFKNLHDTLESIISSGIKGAFVHASTAAHFEIIKKLLDNNIHVYVDKPITADFPSSENLVGLAASKKLILSVGFNRRFAPAYVRAKELREPNMVILQKNRKSLPGEIRSFIFDDFIHVIDTILFLFPYAIDQVNISGKKLNGLLHHVSIQLTSKEGNTAIGIMNRDSGTTEEILEVFTSTEKMVVYNVSDVVVCRDKHETKIGNNDWQPMLHKRGFEQVIIDFLNAVPLGNTSIVSTSNVLGSHRLCEDMVLKLSAIQ